MTSKLLKLKELFNINKGDVISIVGTGGKTSLMFLIAKELSNQYNVLITTSTKIIKPTSDMFDQLFTSVDSFIKGNTKNEKTKNGITIISKTFNEENNKLIGIDNYDLEKIIKYFDIIIIESDGSRNLPLKGWKKHEPPVLLKTNKTIGVLPISVLGKKIDESFIYGYEEFKNIVGNIDYIDYKEIGKILTHNEGIFKNSIGERYLFMNQADEHEQIMKCFNLAKYLNENIIDKKLNFKICYGSLKKELFYEYKCNSYGIGIIQPDENK